MTHTPFHSFIDLIEFDRSIFAFEQSIAALDQDISRARAQEEAVVLELETAKKNWHNAKKSVDLIELEMQSLDQQRANKKRRLENSTSHKEYQLVKAEIDTLKEKQHELEKTLLDVWHTLESATKAYEALKADFDSKVAVVHTTIADYEQKKSNIRIQLKECTDKRPALEAVVPQEWLEKYAAMRSRVADPVVRVDRGSCGACYYKISDQDMASLSRNKLIQCKDCYRFLYIESPERSQKSA